MAATKAPFDPVLKPMTGGWLPVPVEIAGLQAVLCFSSRALALKEIARIGGSAPAPIEPWEIPESKLGRVLAFTRDVMQERTGTALDMALGDPVLDASGSLIKEAWRRCPDDWSTSTFSPEPTSSEPTRNVDVRLETVAHAALGRTGEDQDLRERVGSDAKEALTAPKGSSHHIQKVVAARLAVWRRAAEAGIPEGQWLVGSCYDEGLGVVEDKAEAAKWFRKAAEQGYAAAQHKLGLYYYNGEGVAKDKAEAVRWFSKAAEQGSAAAQHILGRCYDRGEGVAQDKAEAGRWFSKADEQGYAAQKAQARVEASKPSGLGAPSIGVFAFVGGALGSGGGIVGTIGGALAGAIVGAIVHAMFGGMNVISSAVIAHWGDSRAGLLRGACIFAIVFAIVGAIVGSIATACAGESVIGGALSGAITFVVVGVIFYGAMAQPLRPKAAGKAGARAAARPPARPFFGAPSAYVTRFAIRFAIGGGIVGMIAFAIILPMSPGTGDGIPPPIGALVIGGAIFGALGGASSGALLGAVLGVILGHFGGVPAESERSEKAPPSGVQGLVPDTSSHGEAAGDTSVSDGTTVDRMLDIASISYGPTAGGRICSVVSSTILNLALCVFLCAASGEFARERSVWLFWITVFTLCAIVVLLISVLRWSVTPVFEAGRWVVRRTNLFRTQVFDTRRYGTLLTDWDGKEQSLWLGKSENRITRKDVLLFRTSEGRARRRKWGWTIFGGLFAGILGGLYGWRRGELSEALSDFEFSDVVETYARLTGLPVDRA